MKIILLLYLSSQYIAPIYGLSSFCPEVFKYDNTKMETDRWFGEINLDSEFPLSGIWIRLALDCKAELVGSTFNEVLSSDNKEFLIKNSSFYYVPGQSQKIQIFVKFSPVQPIPKLESIRINGRTVCPAASIVNFSLCPYIFTFDNARIENNRWYGALNLESEFELKGLWIEISLDAPIEQFETEFGDVMKKSDSLYLIKNSQHTLPPSTVLKVLFWVKYKAFGTIPNIKSIKLNGRKICGKLNSEGPTSNPVLSKPVITHESNTAVSPGSTKPDVSQNGQVACGTVEIDDKIVFGRQAVSSQWPWHGAMYKRNTTKGDTFICGMSLISEGFSVTAAHCVTENVQTKKLFNKDILILYFGLTNLNDVNEGYVQNPNTYKIFVYPEYSISGNDIAIIQFDKPVVFSNKVRPICLWEEESEINRILVRQGTVVGFGVTENDSFSPELLYADISVVSNTVCEQSNPSFYSKYTSATTFCAGTINQSAPCNGDSGGGLVFRKEGTGTWQIRGIVSRGVRRIHSFLCDNAHYVVFTDVAKFTTWIRQIIIT